MFVFCGKAYRVYIGEGNDLVLVASLYFVEVPNTVENLNAPVLVIFGAHSNCK